MKISSLAFRGVASLPDLERDLVSTSTGRPHDLVVVSGPPASGKTRFCEVILAALETVGPYRGIVRASDWYGGAQQGARVELGLWLSEDERGDGSAAPAAAAATRAVVHFTGNGGSTGRATHEVDRAASRLLGRYDHDPAHGKREYFPEDRQRAWGARDDGLGAPEQSLLRCSRDPQKYSFVPRFLASLRSDAARSRTFAAGLERLSSGVRHVPAARGSDPTACFSGRGGQVVRYADLSSSEADAVIIAATASMIGLSHSIVLLDRPELYVSSDRLVAWVNALAGLGDDNQWIVATSDAGLAASVDRSRHISLAHTGGRPS